MNFCIRSSLDIRIMLIYIILSFLSQKFLQTFHSFNLNITNINSDKKEVLIQQKCVITPYCVFEYRIFFNK